MFCKSTAKFASHRLWQRACHVPTQRVALHIKLQADVVAEFTVVSFGEK